MQPCDPNSEQPNSICSEILNGKNALISYWTYLEVRTGNDCGLINFKQQNFHAKKKKSQFFWEK